MSESRPAGIERPPEAIQAAAEISRETPGIAYRPLLSSEADRVVDLILSSRAVDGPPEPISRELVRHFWFDVPGFDLEHDSFAAVDPHGVIVGIAGAFAREHPTRRARVYMGGTVHPAHRRAGIGTRLLRLAEIRARVQLLRMPEGLPREVSGDAQAGAAGQIALFEAEGYRPIREFATMLRSLDAAPTLPPEPPGITFVAWRDDLSEGTRLAHNDAFRDHWGSEPEEPDRWQHYVHEMPGFSTETSWLALDGATVVGYSLCLVTETGGRSLGWLGTVGVRRDYRRRGIGAALVARSLVAMRAAGLDQAGLDVDTENPTGAVRVYAGLGFGVGNVSIVYSKAIAV